jgi:hypothetical protein
MKMLKKISLFVLLSLVGTQATVSLEASEKRPVLRSLGVEGSGMNEANKKQEQPFKSAYLLENRSGYERKAKNAGIKAGLATFCANKVSTVLGGLGTGIFFTASLSSAVSGLSLIIWPNDKRPQMSSLFLGSVVTAFVSFWVSVFSAISYDRSLEYGKKCLETKEFYELNIRRCDLLQTFKPHGQTFDSKNKLKWIEKKIETSCNKMEKKRIEKHSASIPAFMWPYEQECENWKQLEIDHHMYYPDDSKQLGNDSLRPKNVKKSVAKVNYCSVKPIDEKQLYIEEQRRKNADYCARHPGNNDLK